MTDHPGKAQAPGILLPTRQYTVSGLKGTKEVIWHTETILFLDDERWLKSNS